MSAFFAIFESMGEVMDIFQSKSALRSEEYRKHTQEHLDKMREIVDHLNNSQDHIKKMREIVQRSGMHLDRQAMHSDYLKIKHDFDVGAAKVLYDKRAS